MDEWESMLMVLAMCAETEQPCEVCGDIHEKQCEPESLGGYRDPAEDPRFA